MSKSKKLIGSKEQKVKAKFSQKKANYAAKAGKNQGDLEKGDAGFASIVKAQDEAIKALTAAATEKLKRVTDKEKLDIDRKIEDWKAKWKKISDKLDPSSLFDGISGGKGLGGVKARWTEWKIQADRKMTDAALKYEFKQYDEYIENEKDLKKIKNTRMESHQKFIEELNGRSEDVAKRIKDLENENEEVEQEIEKVDNDPSMRDALNFKSEYISALDEWKAEIAAVIQSAGKNKDDDKKVGDAKTKCLQAYKQMDAATYKVLADGDAKGGKLLKDASKKQNDEVEIRWTGFETAIKSDIAKLEKENKNHEIKKSGGDANALKKAQALVDKEVEKKEELEAAKKLEQDKLSALSQDMQGPVVAAIAKLDDDIKKAEEEINTAKSNLPKNNDKSEIAQANLDIAKNNLKIAKLNKDGIEKAEIAVGKADTALKSSKAKNESLKINKRYIILENQNKIKTMKKLKTLNEWLTLKESAEFTGDRGPDIGQIEPFNNTNTGSNNPEVSSPDLTNEIDTILDKLRDLESGLDEDADSMIMEGPVDFIKDYMKSGKVKSLQSKANQLKKKEAKLQKAKIDAEDPKKKEKIKQQTDGVKDMIKQTEGSIDDIADNAGPYTSKVKNVLRAKGNLEVIKIKLKDGSMDKKSSR
jgi:hypothetical protein